MAGERLIGFKQNDILERSPWQHALALGKRFAKPDARRPLRGMLVSPGERG